MMVLSSLGGAAADTAGPGPVEPNRAAATSPTASVVFRRPDLMPI
jgi:hypothetical protein